MQHLVFLLFLFFLSGWTPSYSQDNSNLIPTPFIQGVNVMTGLTEEENLSTISYEKYQEGWNQLAHDSLYLSKNDFRIGKVKTIYLEPSQAVSNAIYLCYEPGVTLVYDTPERASAYYYSDKQLINAVEHYQMIHGDLALYRRERLFWQEKGSIPLLVSRVLEDAEGQAVLSYYFFYNARGQILKETLAGNLSGHCQIPLLIEPNGYPQANGIESYSTTYTYSEEDPDFLLFQQEDNGLTTVYQYDPLTKQCIGKLRGSKEEKLSRCFYLYDKEGFLLQTMMDDGQGETPDDLTGVSQRQILESQIGNHFPLLGQPLKMETRYWDSQLQQEQILDKQMYTYSVDGQLIQQDFYDTQGILHYSLQHVYDNQGQLVSTLDSRGEMVKKNESSSSKESYNLLGQRIASFDAYGNQTSYTYDPLGRLTTIQLPAVLTVDDEAYHPTISQTYNICDQVIQIRDAKGGRTSIAYNIRGKPATIIYPDGSEEVFTYFLDGVLQRKIARDGMVEEFERDSLGRIVRSERCSSSGCLLQQLFYTYQGELLQSVTDGTSFTTRFLYDGAGRQTGKIQETIDGIKRVEWSYDACGQKNQIREWFGPGAEDFVIKLEETDEAQHSRVICLESPEGQQHYRQGTNDHFFSPPDFIFSQVSTVQNSLGQIVKQEEQIDGNGTRQILTYDALQRLERIEKYDSLGTKLVECHIRYDAHGNKLLERHAVLAGGQTLRQFTICWTYDACDRLLSIVEGEGGGSKITSYCYNLKGQLKKVIKPDGISIHYLYNEQGQMARLESSDHSIAYQYFYDSLHRLVAIQDLCRNSLQTRCYNAFHELMEEVLGPGIKTCHRYDLAGRRVQLILPDLSQVVYHYRGALLSSIERLGADHLSRYTHSYLYDSAGCLQAHSLAKGLGTVNYQYDEKGDLLSIESPWWSQYIEKEAKDPYGRLLQMKIQNQRGTHLSTFEYTESGQLSKEEGYHYTYDSLYNRLSENGKPWKVNELNQLVKTPEALYEYDANGNLIKQISQNKTIHYSYDALDRLVRVEYSEKQAVTYVYDAFHRRIEQSIWEWDARQLDWTLQANERFLYDGFKEIGKLNVQDKITELRILGQGKGAEIGAAIALELQEKLFIPLHDSLGSVRCLVDACHGLVVENYDYSAYGQETLWNAQGMIIEQSEVGNPWRFFSKRVDEQTHLIFFGKRYYDPRIGRWITPDPIFFADTPNVYAFAKNDAINHYDLYGHFSMSQIWGGLANAFFICFHYLQSSAHHARLKWNAELKLPPYLGKSLEKIGKTLFGDSTYLLLGNSVEETQVGCYGQREISDKVRVTFINGILTTRSVLLYHLDMVSNSHGGVKIHYIFRPTEGWTWDISRAILIRTAFYIGLRSMHAHLLAQLWRELIQEMGGTEGGGVIIHYAHSLGGSETDRARGLLLPEEQKMIRVTTFGSATLIRNKGFQSVVNIVSINDGVSSFILEPLGHLRNYFDPQTNVRFYGTFWVGPYWPTDHLLNGPTYGPLLHQLGEQFLAEFNSL